MRGVLMEYRSGSLCPGRFLSNQPLFTSCLMHSDKLGLVRNNVESRIFVLLRAGSDDFRALHVFTAEGFSFVVAERGGSCTSVDFSESLVFLELIGASFKLSETFKFCDLEISSNGGD